MSIYKVEREVPAILTEGNKAIPVGTLATVTKEYWRNGEGWFRTKEYGDVPDVFFSIDPVEPTYRSRLRDEAGDEAAAMADAFLDANPDVAF